MFLFLLGYVVIPIYTIYFVGTTSIVSSNFSSIGSAGDSRFNFIIWGFVLSGYYMIVLGKILSFLKCNVWCYGSSVMALLCFGLTISIPYLPKDYPINAQLHVFFSFAAAGALIAALYLLVISLYKMNEKKYEVYLYILHGIVLVSMVIYKIGSMVTSILEIFFVLATMFFLHSIQMECPLFANKNSLVR